MTAIALHAAPAARISAAPSGSHVVANAAGISVVSDSGIFAEESVPGEVLVKFKPGAETQVRSQVTGASSLAKTTSVASFKGLESRFRFKGIKQIQDDPYDAITRKLESMKAPGAAPANAKRDRMRKRLERAQTQALLSKRGRVYKMKFDVKGETQKQLLSELGKNPDIEWAQPNHIYRTRSTTPNDPGFTDQPFLQTIHAQEAWDATTGSENVVVAVIDVGVDWTHPDLAANIWSNAGEIDGDGIDNDGNGFIDDVRGWDFVDVSQSEVDPGEDFGPPDNDPMDFHSHGTHVSGIVAGCGNNGVGITGVTWKTKIMPLRAGYSTQGGNGALTEDAIIGALHYAALNGADIINMSFGSPYYSQAEYEAIRFAYDGGCLLVAGAGNSSSPLKFYPADFNEVIAVAATGGTNFAAVFSNYGANVDIAAPGVNVLSTIPNNGYRKESGTSMASPVVAGVAALVMAAHPDWTRDQVAHQLLATATDIDGTNFHMRGLLGSGLVNAAQAVGPYYSGVNVHAADPTLMDTQGNQNGLPEPGETVDLLVSLRNYSSANSFTARISGNDPYIQVIRSDADYGAIGEGMSKTNSSSPFQLKLAANVPQDYQTTLSMDIYSGASLVKTEPIDLNRINSRWGGIHLMGTSGIGTNQMLRLPDGRIFSLMVNLVSPFSSLSVTSRSADGTWDEPYFLPINRTVYNFAATVDAQMNVYVAYIGLSGDFPHCDVFLTKLDHASGAWSPELQVTSSGQVSFYAGDLTMAAEPEGTNHVVWMDNRTGGEGFYSRTVSGSILGPESLVHGLSGLPYNYLSSHTLGDGSRDLLYWVDGSEYKRSGTPGGWGPEISLPTNPSQFTTEPFVFGNDLYRMARSPSDPATSLQILGSNAWASVQNLFTGYYLGAELLPPYSSALSMFGLGDMEYLSTDGGPDIAHLGETGGVLQKQNLFGQRQVNGNWSGYAPYDEYTRNYSYQWPMQQKLVNDGINSSYSVNLQFAGFWQIGNYLYRTTEPVALQHFPTRPVINITGLVPDLDGLGLSFHLASDHPQGIRYYEYALGTLPGQTDLSDWTLISTPDYTARINKADVAPNQEFYLSVRAHSKGVYSSAMAVSAPLTTGMNIMIPVPGRIEVEDYNYGGEGVGYHDATAGNFGGKYRNDDVDIEVTGDATGAFDVTTIQPGEWLDYDVNVTATGYYTLTARVVAIDNGPKSATIAVDGINAATLSFNNPSVPGVYQNVVFDHLRLTAGPHTLRINMGADRFSWNYLDVTPKINQPPVADAGPDRTLLPNHSTYLDGGASSDPDGYPQPLAYVWAQISGPAVALANANSVLASFTPTVPGTYVFRLTVADGSAASYDDIVITVPVVYTLTTVASPAAGGSISGGGVYFPSDNSSLVATPAAGYVFTNWTGDLTGTTNPTYLVMTGDKTVTAVFNPQIKILVKQTVAAATASSTETGHPAADAIDGNATTTRWGSAFSDPQKIVFDMGTAKSITTAVLDWQTSNAKNYTLEGSNDPAFTTKTVLATKTNMPTGDHRIDSLAGLTGAYRYYRMSGTARNTMYGYSIWEARFYASATVTVYSINASAGANGSISPSGSVAVNQGSAQAFTITPAAGYVVDIVSVDGVNQGSVTSYTFSNVAANHSISATFKPAPQYTLTVSAANGTVALSPAGGTYVSGTVVTLTATPNTGYKFGSWSGAVTGTANPVSVTMTANKSVTANFTALPTYTVTATAGTNGTVSPSGTVTTYQGTARVFTMAPATGYLVNAVTVDGAAVGAVTTYTFPATTTGTHTLAASFKKDPSLPLPGRIQAEDYKLGGEGVGYHDLTTGNAGGQYRTDNVDIQATTDAGGGYNVGWIQAGEWLAYDVNVAAAGTYSLTARMASGTAGTKSAVLSVDGVNVATFSFTNASGTQSWQNVTVTGVKLTAGVHVMRVTMSTSNFNLNYIDVK
ncbi:MAG: S8 family serine peptidase [Fibrobacteres bacterium]|nr:S8 family serine peptidase [Fibrobacterota bacterium]